MSLWDMWKKGFDAWEASTARYLEQVMQSPLVLGPSGAMLTAAMKAKAASDQAVARWWGRWACRRAAIRSAPSTP